jgi:curved DNA-binding protein CbpA
VDDIFDRLGNLFKSMFQDSNDDSFGGNFHSSSQRTGDPDLDAAYDELNDFLNKDLSDSDRRERDDSRRSQAEAQRAREYAAKNAQSGSSHSYGQTRPSNGPSQGLVNDYRVFDLPVGTKLPQVKTVYKKILMEFHPDRHAGNPEMLKKSTEYSSKVNAAYQRIEHYLETGKYEAS